MAKHGPEGKANKNVRDGLVGVTANVINQSTRNLKQVGNSAGREKRGKSGPTLSGVPKYNA